MKEKKEMEVGKRYRGYGFINEYREFQFEPEDTGSRAGIIKQVVSKDGINISHSANFILIRLKVPKPAEKGALKIIVAVSQKINHLLTLLKEYEI